MAGEGACGLGTDHLRRHSQLRAHATEDSDEEDPGELRIALEREKVDLKVIAPHLRTVGSHVVERTPVTARSIEFDPVAVAEGLRGTALAAHPRTRTILEEACGIDTSAKLTLDLTQGLVRA